MIWRFWTIGWWHTQWHNIKIGLGNFKYWVGTIYLDRWWDHFYLYSILRHKLVHIEKNFREHGVAIHTEKELKKIKICILLLDRLLNDAYIDYSKRENIRESLEKEERMTNQDLDLLFKILRKQIRSWWD